ncbi:hypothetical protein Tco_0048865 [Tanacetum coccineum]
MSNNIRSSRRVIRVPMRFRDCVVKVRKKKTGSKISVEMSDDGSNKGGMMSEVQSSSESNDNEYASVNEYEEDNVNIKDAC